MFSDRRPKPPAISWPGTIRSSRYKRLIYTIGRSEVCIPSGTRSYFPNSNLLLFCTNKSKNSALICTDGGTRTPTHLGFLRDGCGNSTTLIPKLAACANLPLSSASFVFPKRLSRTGLARLPFVLSAEQPHCSVKRQNHDDSTG